MVRAERLRFGKLGHDFQFRLNRSVMLLDELIGIGPVVEFRLWLFSVAAGNWGGGDGGCDECSG